MEVILDSRAGEELRGVGVDADTGSVMCRAWLRSWRERQGLRPEGNKSVLKLTQ